MLELARLSLQVAPPAHFAREAHGATIISEPTDYPYGERQYSAQDLAGYGLLTHDGSLYIRFEV